MSARPSEIRAFLLRYAAEKGILVHEHVSDWRDGPIAFYAHLQAKGEAAKTATAVSYQHFDNALVMAFLSFLNPEINFLTDKID